MEITKDTKFDEVAEWLAEQAVAGNVLTCPCCDQTVKIYERKLNAPMARILLIIFRYFERNGVATWLHVDDYLKNFSINCRYYSLLERWELIEAMQGVRDDGSRRTGFWAITERGRQFCRNEIEVPSFFLMYNQQNFGFSNEQVSINDCLGIGGFHYAEVMQAIDATEIELQPRRVE